MQGPRYLHAAMARPPYARTTIGRKGTGCSRLEADRFCGPRDHKHHMLPVDFLTLPHERVHFGKDATTKRRHTVREVEDNGPETVLDVSHAVRDRFQRAVYLRYSPHYRYRWQETTIMRRVFPVGTVRRQRAAYVQSGKGRLATCNWQPSPLRPQVDHRIQYAHPARVYACPSPPLLGELIFFVLAVKFC
jgi:hypothetical protein